MKDITEEQANSYLINKLDFPNWRHVLKKDREEFLKEFVKRQVCTVYFHNLYLALPEPEERTIPTLEQILELGLSGNGGLCNQLNIFAKHLLKSVGFSAFAIAGTWSSSLKPGTHCMCIVNIDNAKKYLVDIASGSPNYEPIPLHKLPHRGFAGGYEYEFRRAPDGISYQRIQFQGSLIKGDFQDRKEEVRYTFELKEVNVDDIEPAMTFIYTSPKCYLFNMPFIFRHLPIGPISGDDIDFVLVWGRTVVKGKKDSREVVKFESFDELHDSIINNYFPNLDRTLLSTVIAKFKQYQCIPYRF